MCLKPKDTYDEPFAEFDEQEKRVRLARAWLSSIKNARFLRYRYLCDENGA